MDEKKKYNIELRANIDKNLNHGEIAHLIEDYLEANVYIKDVRVKRVSAIKDE